MPQFRKKPVVINAMEYDGANAAAILFWVGQSDAAVNAARLGIRLASFDKGVLRLRTLESGDGWHIADVGDWIICGVKGEFYPCKPDVFAETYDAVDPSVRTQESGTRA